MSRRPSSTIRATASAAAAGSACCVTSTSGVCRTCDYAIIGDTTSAVLYANRLACNGVTGTITLITEGTNQTTVNGVQDLDFAVVNSQNITSFLTWENVALIPSGGGTGPFPGTQDISYSYYYGAGPCGDFIASYIIPQNGPWYNRGTTYLNRFFQAITTPSCPNSTERVIIDGLSTMWGIPKTINVVVSVPSILDGHFVFTYNNGGTELRELGIEVFNRLNVNLIQGVSNIQYSGTTGNTGLYNITTTGNGGTQILINNKLVWQNNPFSFLHLATVGSNTQPSLRIPVFYRATVTIPNNTGVVNLNNITPGPDLVTTYVSFSLYDLDNTNNRSAFIWLGQAYTTSEDFYDVSIGGNFAPSGSSFLIVECICLANLRTVSYSVPNQQIIIQANSGEVEAKWEYKFAEIVADIYAQYTGSTVDPQLLITNSAVCSSTSCTEFSSVNLYAIRESPMVTVLETVGSLYGNGLYPNFR